MNRKDRNLLAQNLRHYLSERITNFEFMDNIKNIYRSDDKAVIAIKREFWFMYCDLREHKNKGRDKLNFETENHIKRFILFLKSDNEYKYKSLKFPNLIKWFLKIVTFNLCKDNPKKQITEKGDLEVWPFFKKSEYIKEIKKPKYLNSIVY